MYRQARQRLPNLLLACRAQQERGVREVLGKQSACAERDDRAEHRVLHAADQHFQAARLLRHQVTLDVELELRRPLRSRSAATLSPSSTRRSSSTRPRSDL